MARHSTFSNLARSWLQLLLLLACLVGAADSDPPTVIMTYPPRAHKNEPTIYFNPTGRVQFNWTSTFPRISLELYQGPRADGLWVMYPLLSACSELILSLDMSCLALQWNGSGRSTVYVDVTANKYRTTHTANISNTTSTFNWETRLLSPMSHDDAFHLRLFNAEGADCNRCHSNSSFFEIKQSADSGSNPRPKEKHALKLGLGLGLGLGIWLLISLTGLLLCCCRVRQSRRVKKREEAASQNCESLVNWNTTEPSVPPTEGWQDGTATNAELGGGSLVDMSGVTRISEAPSNPAVSERVELEGDSKRD